MIVRMKKITVVVQTKDINFTLDALRKIGVLHIEHQTSPVDDDVTRLEERFKRLSRAIEVLPETQPEESFSGNPDELATEIVGLVDRLQDLGQELSQVRSKIEVWKEWGDFDPDSIEDLANKNIWVRLCRLTKKDMQRIPEDVALEILFRKANIYYCAVISTRDVALPFNVLSLPERGLSEMQGKQREIEEEMARVNERLTALARYRNALVKHKTQLYSLIEFYKVRAGRGRFARLSYIIGYCPANSVGLLEKSAAEQSWGLAIDEPAEGDRVPTLIKNPRWIEIIKPVFNMIKTLPGYREVDISLWFLLFLSVFFGILIGDAGYGAIFLTLNFILHIRFKKLVRDRSIFYLMYVLSFCTILWGILSGTFFGQAWLPKRVEPLLPYLRDNQRVQEICFFIGALHLSIAHGWRLVRKLPSLRALSEAGWILMLWAAYYIAKALILGQGFPQICKWFLISGASLIILFTGPSRNIVRSLGYGIGDLLLHVVNSFTDIVSYIRLFAVGAATVAVADAFNQLAVSIGFNNILTGFVTALILLFGHILNILLGAMAILVHGVRLNMLEFSSHLNMEWSGVEYTPFREHTES